MLKFIPLLMGILSLSRVLKLLRKKTFIVHSTFWDWNLILITYWSVFLVLVPLINIYYAILIIILILLCNTIARNLYRSIVYNTNEQLVLKVIKECFGEEKIDIQNSIISIDKKMKIRYRVHGKSVQIKWINIGQLRYEIINKIELVTENYKLVTLDKISTAEHIVGGLCWIGMTFMLWFVF